MSAPLPPPAAPAGVVAAPAAGEMPAPTVTELVPAPVPAAVNIYLLAGSALVPVTLPAEAPLSMLVEPTVQRVNARLASQGDPKLPDRLRYEFAWIDQGALSEKPTATLLSCGVRRGDMLQLVPQRSALRYTPRNENVASSLASYLRSAVAPVTAETALAVGNTAMIVALLAATAVLWRSRAVMVQGWVCAAAMAALAGVAWLAAVLMARRWPQYPAARDGFIAAGIVVAAATLAAVPPHLGAPNVMLGSAALTAFTVTFTARAGRYWSVSAAVATLGGLAAAAALVASFGGLSAHQIGIAGVVAALVMTTRAPTIGAWIARLPRQPFRSLRNRDVYDHVPGQPDDTVSPVEEADADPTALTTEQVAAAADRARAVLIGLCSAVAVLQLACGWLAVGPQHPHPRWTVVLVVAVAAEIIVQARRFNDRVQAVLLVGSSTVALIGIGVKSAVSTPPGQLHSIGMAVAATLVPALMVFTLGVGWKHLFSTATRKALEWLGYLLLAGIGLLAAYVLDIFSFFRTQGIGF